MKVKKILLLCTEDTGGAGKATVKLLSALLELNYVAILLVKRKTELNNNNIVQFKYNIKKKLFVRRVFNKISRTISKPQAISTNKDYYFYNECEGKHFIDPKELLNHIAFKPDLIISTWTAGFLNFKTLFLLSRFTGSSVYIWTADMGALTGGCHYAWDCNGYQLNCENCPAVSDLRYKKIANQNLKEKQKWVKPGKLNAFGGSGFTQNQIALSSLFKNQNFKAYFPGIIDQKIFNPTKRNFAKRELGIHDGKKVIFAGAFNGNERRKGFPELTEILLYLEQILNKDIHDNTVLLVVGNFTREIHSTLEINYIPFIQDENIFSLYYQAADVFLCPSIQDSGPQMTLQALACGTPVVCFDIGFGFDIIQSFSNGFSVPLGDLQQFATRIKYLLEVNSNELAEFSANAVHTIDKISSLNAFDKFMEVLFDHSKANCDVAN